MKPRIDEPPRGISTGDGGGVSGVGKEKCRTGQGLSRAYPIRELRLSGRRRLGGTAFESKMSFSSFSVVDTQNARPYNPPHR